MKQGTNETIASQVRDGYSTGVAKEVVEWKLITKGPAETETVASYIEKVNTMTLRKHGNYPLNVS